MNSSLSSLIRITAYPNKKTPTLNACIGICSKLPHTPLYAFSNHIRTKTFTLCKKTYYLQRLHVALMKQKCVSNSDCTLPYVIADSSSHLLEGCCAYI